MPSVIWVEGVDLDETMFDTGKLSVIRGSSRALEQMADDAAHAFASLGATSIARGASMAGFVVDVDETVARKVADDFVNKHLTRNAEPFDVAKSTKATTADEVAQYAPYAHLRFHHAVVEVDDSGPDLAIETARARVRAAQLREPGVRTTYQPLNGFPCEFDRFRPAEREVDGPAKQEGVGSSLYSVSRSAGARWHFGRAIRQKLYNGLGVAAGQPLAFVDDFEEMVAPECLKNVWLPKMPESLQNKIAVFCADGDGFTKVRDEVKKAKGAKDGLALFSHTLDQNMRKLLGRLINDLTSLRDHPDGVADDLRAGVSLPLSDTWAHRKLREDAGLTDDDRLLRFETLLFGGDDTLFVVPAWLGWWLAITFMQETESWAPVVPGNDNTKLHFSGGLVFASRKTPIRALKNLAHDLMIQAKVSGGLEVEVLESVEPPAEGLWTMRNKLLGEGWLLPPNADGKRKSRLTIPRDGVRTHFDNVADAEALPASPLYKALREARRTGAADGAGGLSGSLAADKATELLAAARKRSAGLGSFDLESAGWLPEVDQDSAALRLHFMLQQRDYVEACAPFVEAMLGPSQVPSP